MITRNILSLGLLLVVGVAAVVVYNDRAQAQATGARRWEYCTITHIGQKSSISFAQTQSFAMITYFGTTGIRIEEVVGREPDGKPIYSPLQAVTLQAIAKLGEDGWEVVGNENFNLAFNPETVKGLLFKRPR
jgi:hypothetical protein